MKLLPLSDFYEKSYIKAGQCPVCGPQKHHCFADADGHWPILGWAIWYGSGKCYESREYTIEELPGDDVQVIRVYFFKEGKARCIVDVGEDQYKLPGSDRVLYGKWLGTLEYPEPFNYIQHLARKHRWLDNGH